MEDDWPLQESERQFFADCKWRAVQNAILPAATLGVIAGRVLQSRGKPPSTVLAAGLGVAGVLGSVFAYGGAQGCVREFASAPVFPTAIALRSALRASDPSHPLLLRFDRSHPGHDQGALANGVVPAVRISETTMARLRELDGEMIAAEARQRAREEARQRAEQAISHATTTQLASSSAATPSRNSGYTPSAAAASSSHASDRRPTNSSSAASSSPSTDGRPPSSFGWGDGDVKRKLVVKRNEFGDEVIEEEEEMKPE